jgi:hypothetical protein
LRRPARPWIATTGLEHGRRADRKVADLQAQIDAYRDLSTSLAFEPAESVDRPV